MRGRLLLAFTLIAPAFGSVRAAAADDDANWRPARQHSTIDRSQFVQQAELPGQDFELQDDAAETPALLQLSHSPEVGPIQGPSFQPEPMESYYPDTVDGPGDGYPDGFAGPRPWIGRKSTIFTATTLPAGDNQIGWSDVDLQTTLAFPRLKNLTVTPGFQMNFVDGPTQTDLPEKLYNQQIEFRWKEQVTRPFWYEVALAPGIYTDYQRHNSDAFRLRAQFLAFFAFSYETQVVAGLYYLDRFDINFLPIVGLLHSPREDIKLNLVFPAPKIAKRVWQGSWDVEWWLYLAGEFGGGSWAIEREEGVLPGGRRNDQIAYRDWRLMLGMERNVGDQNRTLFLEAGYVFNRALEYESGRGDFDPDSTAMLRGGFAY